MKPITNKLEVNWAMEQVKRSLKGPGAHPYAGTIGYQGNSSQHEEIYWDNKRGFWFCMEQHRPRYWLPFGTVHPQHSSNLSITCEINPPLSGINRRCAGILLRDGRGQIALAHSGKVGGGRKGIGQKAFLRWYRQRGRKDCISVEWPRGRQQAILIGRVGAANFPDKLFNFIMAVKKFKESINGREPPKSLAVREKASLRFRPEFSGKYRAAFKVNRHVRRLHGRIVNALRDTLGTQGYRVGNDRHRDLVVAGRGRSKSMLFEAKTGARLSDLYTGVGQLLIHGNERRVLVLPHFPDQLTLNALEQHHIEILRFRDDGGRITFPNLGQLLNAHKC